MTVVIPNVFGTAVSPVAAGGLDQNFNALANAVNAPLPQTPAESSAGITPSNLTFLPGDIRRYGAVIDGVTDDTAAWTTAITLAGGAGAHAQESTIKAVAGTSMVSQITFNQAGIKYQGNGCVIRGNATTATTSVVDIIAGSATWDSLYVDGNFNPNYQCAIHWYTYNLNLYDPGFCRFNGVYTSGALIGLCIGGLPTQAVPLPVQGSGPGGTNPVVAPGLATDAPLSESSVVNFVNVSCVQGIFCRQPNGKVTFQGATIIGSHAGWMSYGYGFSAASTAALIISLDPTQTTEIVLSGGSLEQNGESTGTFIQIANGQLFCNGVIMETVAPSYISASSHVSFNQCPDLGFNFPSNYTPFLIDQAAAGMLCFSRCEINYPAGGLLHATGTPFVKSATSLAGTYAINTNGFTIHFADVELRDVPVGAITATAQFFPTVLGVRSHYSNCKYTSYTAAPAITTQYDVDDANDLLRAVVDESNYTITAYGANGNNVTSGGWTFTVSVPGDSWGSAPSGITVLQKVIDKCLQLGSGAVGSGHSTNATSPKFGVEPQRPYILRVWLNGGTTGSTMGVSINWLRFDGSASATPSTTLYGGPDTGIGTVPIPCEFLVDPPKDACQAQVVLNAQNGAIAQFTEISMM